MQQTTYFICLLLFIDHTTTLQYTAFAKSNVCKIGSISARFEPGHEDKPASCFVSEDGTSARCDRMRDWTPIQNLSSGIRELSITGSWLYRIPNNSFRHLPELETLRITDAAVLCAEPCAFCGLPNLTGLDLTSNLIQPPHYPFITASLEGKNLNFLFLDRQRALNAFEKVPNLDQESLRAFRNISINFLSLTDNKIADFQPEWLSYLKDVRCMSMAWNKLALFRPWGPNVQIMHGLHKMRSLNMLDVSFQAVYGEYGFQFSFRERRQADCKRAIRDYREKTCQPKALKIKDLKKLPPGANAFSGLPPQLTRFYLEQEEMKVNVGHVQSNAIVQNTYISVINVSYNNLLFSEAASFCVIPAVILGLDCLREVYNRGCPVVDIQEQTLANLPNIEVMDFSYGQINSPMLTRPLFQSNRNLHTLIFEGCGLTCQGTNRKDSFLIAPSLQNLSLVGNNIDCFPTTLIENLPSLKNFRMTGHRSKWFDSEAMLLIDKLLKESNNSETGNLSLDIRGAFHCTCDPESLAFISWYKKGINSFADGNLTTCQQENGTEVLLIDLDLNLFRQKCPNEPTLHSLPTVTYISLGIVALAVLAAVTAVAINRAKIWYYCLTSVIRWRSRRDSSLEVVRLMESDGTDHVMLVYHRSDGFAVGSIRLSLLKKRCPVFDMDTGLNLSVDESGHPVPADSDWHRAGGFKSVTFMRGLREASVVVIMTSPIAVRDYEFRFNVDLVQEHLYRYRHLRVILMRQEHHLESAAFSWSTISGLRARDRVKNWVIADGDHRRLDKKMKRIVAFRDSFEPLP